MIRILKGILPKRATGREAYLRAEAEAVSALESLYKPFGDGALRNAAEGLKDRVRNGERLEGTLRREAFALVREAASRVLGQRPYDVQVMAAVAMSDGRIAEMKTGEGKTLAAAMPSFLFALAGRGVHVVTVNDYLAGRDAAHVGRVHEFLGLSVGVIAAGMEDARRRQSYACDVTYGTNSEFGFDFLRDNLRLHSTQTVQRGLEYALIDEADSVLVDEARTPLVISGPSPVRAEAYAAVARIVGALDTERHIAIDEKERSAVLTEEGQDALERAVSAGQDGLPPEAYSAQDPWLARAVDAGLKARMLFENGRDYVVSRGEAVIVDANTGRMMPGRRFNDGLHQAIEAKEGLEVKPESQTLASITYQNFYRMYGRLCGMTGTAATEREELGSVYALDVSEIPTHRPVARIDEDDEVYLTEDAKLDAVVEAVAEAAARGQPVLVGTPSVLKSEELAARLVAAGFERSEGVPDGSRRSGRTFSVLNARNHHLEAAIVEQAGLPGAITVSTNMAGRGTDIQLGGSLSARLRRLKEGFTGTREEWETIAAAAAAETATLAAEAREAGGLFVIGTERHDNRRIDNQLRGRSGRQGGPGRSRFYVSLDDETVRVFAPESFRRMLGRLGLSGRDAIRHPLVSRLLEKAQTASEARGREIRSKLLEYDDIADQQRKAFHAFRQETMASDDLSEDVRGMLAATIERIVSGRVRAGSLPGTWDLQGLKGDLASVLRLDLPVEAWAAEEGTDEAELEARIEKAALDRLDDVEAKLGPKLMRLAEKTALIQSADEAWRSHMAGLEELKAAVGLRTVAGRNPLVEFRTDAFAMFEALTLAMATDTASMLMRLEAVEAPRQAA